MAKDYRVILIKLCDRLHNVRSLATGTPDFQRKQAAETLTTYLPLFERFADDVPEHIRGPLRERIAEMTRTCRIIHGPAHP